MKKTTIFLLLFVLNSFSLPPHLDSADKETDTEEEIENTEEENVKEPIEIEDFFPLLDRILSPTKEGEKREDSRSDVLF